MKIGSSVPLFISNQLATTASAIQKSLKRLSTGKRINSPGDDGAGYALSLNLDSQIRGMNQANLNINKSLGVLQTADSAIDTQIDIVQRLRDLAIQGGNESLTSVDRQSINSEMSELMKQFVQITNETEFDGTKLLDGSFQNVQIQIGPNQTSSLSLGIGSTQASDIFKKTVGLAKFKAVSTISSGDEPDNVAIGDFNGDGINDIASVDDGTAHTLSIRLGRTDGTYGSRKTITIEGDPTSLLIGDVNADGVQDVVVGDDGATESMQIFIGKGDGTFDSRVTYTVTESNGQSVLADINNDGALDIIVGQNTTQIGILINNGDGTYQDEVTVATSINSYRVEAGDFDNDGNQDVMVFEVATTGAAQLLLGDGTGGFTAMSTFDAVTGGTTRWDFETGDFNGDGIWDVVAGAGNSTTVNFFAGKGDGSFATAVATTIATGITALTKGDFNSDGILDIAGTNTGATAFEILQGNGSGSFTSVTTGAIGITIAASSSLVAGDLNNDGVDDILGWGMPTDDIQIVLNHTTQASALSDINVSDVHKIDNLMNVLDLTLEELSREKIVLATKLDKLHQAFDTNQLLSESLTDAKDSTEQVDIALETADLVRNQILQEAGLASLAQANVQAQIVMGLLNL